MALTRALAAGALLLAVAACGDSPPSVVEGTSTAASGAPCSPAAALPSTPPTPRDLALPAGALVTAYTSSPSEVQVTGRTTATVQQVLAHFRSAVPLAGYEAKDYEDEGRSAELDFDGPKADGLVTIARLACPRGETGFTVRVRTG